MNTVTKSAQSTTSPARPNRPTDHHRDRFENIVRQPELAPNLTCFQPDHDLSSIRFIANAHSVHVARWLTLLSHTKANVQVDTANSIPAFSNNYLSARPLVPDRWRIPMTLRYILGGLVLRFAPSAATAKPAVAHCASGNGFMAWLSGQPYLIVAYGTEIFSAKERGFAYRWLMKKILQRAERIADCSPECTRVLCEQFQIPAERIYSFHLGYDEQHFRPADYARRMELRREFRLPLDQPVWVVNRRTHPHYRTQEVVRGFLEYCQSGGRGQLVLLCGDHQPGYTQLVCDEIHSHESGHRITVVKQMLTPAEFATWIQLSDFSISVPITDNFSIAILESMGCGTVPILANLDGYDELRECPAIHWMTNYKPSDFAKTFADTAASWLGRKEAGRTDCCRFVQSGYSTEKALHDIADFCLGVPLRKQESPKQAA